MACGARRGRDNELLPPPFSRRRRHLGANCACACVSEVAATTDVVVWRLPFSSQDGHSCIALVKREATHANPNWSICLTGFWTGRSFVHWLDGKVRSQIKIGLTWCRPNERLFGLAADQLASLPVRSFVRASERPVDWLAPKQLRPQHPQLFPMQ